MRKAISTFYLHDVSTKTKRLCNASLREIVHSFGKIAILARLRQDNPDDTQINDMWSDLLEQVNLTEISSQPMVD